MTTQPTARAVLALAPRPAPLCKCGDDEKSHPCRRACSCQVYRPNTDGRRKS